MSVAPVIRTFILGSTGVSALVGTRCHYTQIPGASAKPHVWFRVSSDTEERTMDGVGGLHEASGDIECVADSPAVAQSVAAAVKSRMDGHSGSIGSSTGTHRAQGVFLRDKDDDYVPYTNQSDEGAHVVAFGMQLWYTT